MNRLTTGSDTSASSKARRISYVTWGSGGDGPLAKGSSAIIISSNYLPLSFARTLWMRFTLRGSFMFSGVSLPSLDTSFHA